MESLALLAAQALIQAMTTDAWSAVRERLVQRLRRDDPDGAERAVDTLDRTASEVAGHPGGSSAVVGLLQGRLEPLIAASPELGAALQVGTCRQVSSVLSEQHNDAIYLKANSGSADPLEAMAIHKERFLFYTRANIDSARQSFASLNTREVPGELREEHAAAKRAQDDWLARMEQDVQRYDRELKEGDSAGKVNTMGAASQPWHTRLNDAMTSLAGESCRTTATTPGS
ncbi:hypothetical protein ACIGEZ_28010 [Streptomyces sp. NPDC085481]|uniref:hypothetical protein n=1 Tax=Streptomyces sp. NPDC085481 TaxID=3365727 RepID=UPI0037D597A8